MSNGLGGVGLLVVEWQSATVSGKKKLETEIFLALKPLFRKVSRRFSESSRGSLSLDDLEQAAAEAAWAFMPKYQHEKAVSPGGTFEQRVYRDALRNCTQLVQMHSKSVRPSLHMQRAAKGAGTGSYTGRKDVNTECRIESINDPDWVEPAGFGTPEDALDGEEQKQRLYIALGKLSPFRRRIVQEHFGIGRNRSAQMRDIAVRCNTSPEHMVSELEAALAELKELMEDET